MTGGGGTAATLAPLPPQAKSGLSIARTTAVLNAPFVIALAHVLEWAWTYLIGSSAAVKPAQSFAKEWLKPNGCRAPQLAN